MIIPVRLLCLASLTLKQVSHALVEFINFAIAEAIIKCDFCTFFQFSKSRKMVRLVYMPVKREASERIHFNEKIFSPNSCFFGSLKKKLMCFYQAQWVIEFTVEFA